MISKYSAKGQLSINIDAENLKVNVNTESKDLLPTVHSVLRLKSKNSNTLTKSRRAGLLMVNNKNGLPPADGWAGPNGALGTHIANESKRTLKAYDKQPYLVDEHANSEEDTARGGYAHRQLFELVQNSADALAGVPAGGRIEIRLTEAYLYCADDGEPIDCKGVTALMFSHMSPKRGTREIGRFGLGFKSVLGVTDAPEFFSRSGSFRFDRTRSQKRIGQFVPDAERYPALRLPDPIDPSEYRAKDDTLSKLMEWATNIVRLPLKPEAVDDLGRQMRSFPPEFLLFVKHVRQLTLNGSQSEIDRTLELENVDGEYLLAQMAMRPTNGSCSTIRIGYRTMLKPTADRSTMAARWRSRGLCRSIG